jgi:NAD(P)H-flavin reductase
MTTLASPLAERTPAAALAAGDALRPRSFRVRRRRRETHDTLTLELEPTGGRAPAFEPGQFNMLYLFGAGEVPISISGAPFDGARLQHTIRAVGGVTRGLARLAAGAIVGVRGPFGRGWPLAQADGNDLVLVAGGIGLAPLRPLIHRLLAQRQRYGRIALLYGTRTPEDLLFRHELPAWRAQFDLEVQVTVDRAGPRWRGEVGVVTGLVRRAAFDPANALALICGPEVMMRFSVIELQRCGLAFDRIYLSMERNMQCGVGLCGHCQFGPEFVCRDGPVFRFDRIARLFSCREV